MNFTKSVLKGSLKEVEKHEKKFGTKRKRTSVIEETSKFQRLVAPKTSQFLNDKENRVKVPVFKQIESTTLHWQR